ncbi:hypothetical protein QBC45DRAFT_435760 [Copromyces sp. CBS 386.78]|nr:hypothetical protein QBC45DRAFT_435760 [Copromyces sp. CBS 386.78]
MPPLNQELTVLWDRIHDGIPSWEPSPGERYLLDIMRKILFSLMHAERVLHHQTEVKNYNSCAEYAPGWAYDSDAPLPIFAYRHALEATEPAGILHFIPRDGRIDLSFNGKWFSRRDALHNSIPDHDRFPGTDGRYLLLTDMEQAIYDLGQFGVIDIADFDRGSHDRMDYRLSKNQIYVSTVKDGEWSFNPINTHTRELLETGTEMLPKCPATKKTAG